MTTAQACVRGLLLAALLPEAPRWGRGVARFSPRFADRLPASTTGAMLFADSPQRWGVAPHVEHQVVEDRCLLPRLPSLRDQIVVRSRFRQNVSQLLEDLSDLEHDLVGEGDAERLGCL